MSKILVQFYGNLSTLLAAGVPVLRALQTAQSGLPRRWVRLLQDLHRRLAAGSTLSEAMSVHARTFGVFDRTLVSVGEESGRLPEVLAELTEWLTLARRLRGRFLAAMVLPLVVLHLGALIIPVPFIALSDAALRDYPGMVLRFLMIFYIPAILLWVMIKLTPSSGPIRRLFDSIILRIPILGPGLYHYSLCRFTRSFTIMYSAGVPIVQALRQSLDAIPNRRIHRMLEGSLKVAGSGGSPSEGFSKKLPAEFLALWNVGEQTGDLDRTTSKLAQLHAERAEMWFAAFAYWFPWFIYGLISLVLIYFIFKFYTMLYSSIGSGFGTF